MKTIILALVLGSVLTACNAVPEEKVAPEADGFSQVYEEGLKPANGISADVLADWQKIDAQMQAMVPNKAALFSKVLFQNEIHTVAPDDKRQAGLKLNQAGKNFLADLKAKCWVFNATQDRSNIENNMTELIRGALGLSGDNCLLVISDNQETKRTVTSRTNEIEKYSTASRQIAKVEVKDTAIAAASGFTSATSTLNINGNFVQYPRSSYKYASAKIILTGTFTVVLAGETISGKITGEVNVNSGTTSGLDIESNSTEVIRVKANPPKPTAQFLLEATSSQGAVRLVTKRINNVNQYFLNGTAINAADVPSFLIVAAEYFN